MSSMLQSNTVQTKEPIVTRAIVNYGSMVQLMKSFKSIPHYPHDIFSSYKAREVSSCFFYDYSFWSIFLYENIFNELIQKIEM